MITQIKTIIYSTNLLNEACSFLVAEYVQMMTVDDIFTRWKSVDPKWIRPSETQFKELMMPSCGVFMSEFGLLSSQCPQLRLLFLKPGVHALHIEGQNKTDERIGQLLKEIFSLHASIHIEVTSHLTFQFINKGEKHCTVRYISAVQKSVEGSSEIVASEESAEGTLMFQLLKMTTEIGQIAIAKKKIKRFSYGYLSAFDESCE
jgi:hypothetical protein